MTGRKHDKGDSPFTDDLERNPGIGTSKGGRDDIEGDNTIEGDRDNDTNPAGGIGKQGHGRDGMN